MNRPLIGIVVGVVVAAILVLSACYVVQPLGAGAGPSASAIPSGSTIAPASISRCPSCRTSSSSTKRVLNYDAPARGGADRRSEAGGRLLFRRYRIVDPLLFYQTVNNEIGVQGRLGADHQRQSAPGARQCLHGRHPDPAAGPAHAGDRRGAVNNDTKSFGIQVIDVRMKRVDLPPANSQASSAHADPAPAAGRACIRAEGQPMTQTMTAEADKQAVVILADARQQAEILRGEGDGKATADL